MPELSELESMFPSKSKTTTDTNIKVNWNVEQPNKRVPTESAAEMAKLFPVKKEPTEMERMFPPIEPDIEKVKFNKMGKLMKTLDIIGRPAYALKALIRDAQEENYKQGLTGLRPGREKLIKQGVDAMWRGLTGQQRESMNQIWNRVGIKNVPLLGFISESVVDPLMYGGYSAGIKGVGKGIQAVKEIPAVTKLGEKVAEKTIPITTAVKDMFITKSKLPELADMVDKYLNIRAYKKGEAFKAGVQTKKTIQDISKKTGKTQQEIEQEIVNLIEKPENIPTESIKPIADTEILAKEIKGRLSNILTEEMKAGVPISELQGNMGYFPRITTNEAKQLINEAKHSKSFGNSHIWYPKIQNAIRRKTGDFTLQEWNDLVAKGGVPILGGKTVQEFFMKNPSYAVATREIRSAKAVTSAEFLNDVGKTFGSETNPGWYEQLPSNITKLNKNLEGKFFEPEVSKEITRVADRYINPESSKALLKTFETIQNSWKRWTLAIFPKYHLRNMVGNIWNNYLADVNPVNYSKATAIQMYEKYKNSINPTLRNTIYRDLQKSGITPTQADNIIKQAEETGVLNQGWFGGDIETAIEKQIKGDKSPIGFGMKIGTAIENNSRLAHFIDRLSKGEDMYQASKSVKKYLFDYGDLTYFEKQVMKRALPFYTWTRKNIPLQLEQFFNQPNKYMMFTSALRNREPRDLLKLQYTRPDLYERLPVEFRRDAETVTYVPLEGLLPAADLSKMVRPQELIFELLSPYLKTPIELQWNKSLFFENEIQKYPYETQELLRLDLPVKLKYAIGTILPQARLLNEIDKIVRKQTKKEQLTPSEQVFAQTLSSVYKIKISDLEIQAIQRIEDKINTLQRGILSAELKNRPREKERILKTINKVLGELDRIQ